MGLGLEPEDSTPGPDSQPVIVMHSTKTRMSPFKERAPAQFNLFDETLFGIPSI